VGKTGAVRKILQSQKTFANHLDDFIASQAADAHAAAIAANSKRSTLNRTITADEDTPMPDPSSSSNILEPLKSPPPPHPDDNHPLLMSRVPEPPSDAEIQALLAHPPLTYLEARGTYHDDRPQRTFCEVCGYWGRVRCMKCGTRVCALDCLETHREECVTRYGL
jgi:zinc finger HIT domain-containing protein 1